MTLILSNELRIGTGKDRTDPIRLCLQGWTLDGRLVFEIDQADPKTKEASLRRLDHGWVSRLLSEGE